MAQPRRLVHRWPASAAPVSIPGSSRRAAGRSFGCVGGPRRTPGSLGIRPFPCSAAWVSSSRRTVPRWTLDAFARATAYSRPHHEERAVNGTSTRRTSTQRPGGWCEPGRRRQGMDPGASGPNARWREPRTPVGSGAERQRYRAAPIGFGGDTRARRSHRVRHTPNEGGTAEGTTFRPGRNGRS
jgi:hypothetical protein